MSDGVRKVSDDVRKLTDGVRIVSDGVIKVSYGVSKLSGRCQMESRGRIGQTASKWIKFLFTIC